jgi:hypothetical protein
VTSFEKVLLAAGMSITVLACAGLFAQAISWRVACGSTGASHELHNSDGRGPSATLGECGKP